MKRLMNKCGGCVLWAAVLLLPLSAVQARTEFYDKMTAGVKAVSDEDLDRAEQYFSESTQISTNNSSHTALAEYNLGNVKMHKGDYEDAARHFASALSHDDNDVRADAYYNRGISLYHQAQGLEKTQKLDEALVQASGALEMFEQSLELDATSKDVKANLEIAYDYREMLLEKKEEQEQQQQQDQDQQDDQQKNEDEEKQEDNQQQEKGENEDEEGNKDQDQDQDQSENPEQQQNSEQPQPQDEGEEKPEAQGNQDPSQSEKNQEDAQPEPTDPEEQNAGEEQNGNAGQPPPQMSREEALMLLDAQREQEANERSKYRMHYGTPNRKPIAKPY